MMEWDKIWAINKQKIDPIVPRYAAVADDAAAWLKIGSFGKFLGRLSGSSFDFCLFFFLDGRFGECSLLKLLRCWVTCTGLGMGESFLRTTAFECNQSVLIETTSFQGTTGVGIIALVETHSPSSVFYLMICTLHLK